MMQQEFNLVEAIDRPDAGIRQVAENNEHFLEVARNIARSLAERRHGGMQRVWRLRGS